MIVNPVALLVSVSKIGRFATVPERHICPSAGIQRSIRKWRARRSACVLRPQLVGRHVSRDRVHRLQREARSPDRLAESAGRAGVGASKFFA